MAEACRLPELARRLAPDLWDAYQQAIDVHDRKSDPPPGWWPQIAADAEAFVERTLAERLHAFDTSDLWAASRYLPITSSWDLESWKKETADWPQKLAEFRQRRDAYESETRALLRETAAGVAAANFARDGVRVLGKFFVVLLRVSMTEPGCVVRATPKGGERRQLDRAELLEAGIDLARNALTIDGTLFLMVQVEPPAAIDPPTPRPQSRGPTVQSRLEAWLRGDGSRHRNRSNKEISKAFRADSGIEVGEETIRKARKALGLGQRTKRKTSRAATLPT